MPIDNLDVIDYACIDQEGNAVLVIADDYDWNDGSFHLRLLKKKLIHIWRLLQMVLCMRAFRVQLIASSLYPFLLNINFQMMQTCIWKKLKI